MAGGAAMSNSKLKLVFDSTKNKDLNATMVELHRKHPEFSSEFATLILLEDAKRSGNNIYVVKKRKQKETTHLPTFNYL